MSVRRAPYNIYSTYSRYTAQALRDLASRADTGELIGFALAAIDAHRQPVLQVAGYLKHRPREGHWAISLLQHELLFDNDD